MAIFSGNTQNTPATLRRWLGLARDGRGVTALEYGIVAAFLCLSLLGIFRGFGVVLTSMFNNASSGI